MMANCPVPHNKVPLEVSKPLVTEEEVKDVKAVPYQWWKFGLFNFFLLKRQGWPYFEKMMTHFESRVFSMKFDEWTTFVCDHKGIESIFDFENTIRNPGHGFFNFRPDMMDGHIPSHWSNNEENNGGSNGEKHEEKKVFIMKYIRQVYESSSKNLLHVFQKEFEKMETLEFKNVDEAKMSNPEEMFIKAAHNVVSCMLLDTYFEDPILIKDWTEAIFRPTGIFGSAGDIESLANKVRGWFNEVEKLKDLKTKFPESNLNEHEMFNEVLFMVCGNASPGISNNSINSLHCYLRLSESDKELLKQEADTFFAAAALDHENAATDALEILRSSPHLHSFFLEMLRIHAIPIVYGRAKRDFVLRSTSGNFAINKGDNLCGMPGMVHQDKELYDNPKIFDMHREVKYEEVTNYGFGGLFHVKAGGSNHKCAGITVAMDAVKLMILMFTRCTFVLAEKSVYTGGNILRKYGSDQPLALLKFAYNKQMVVYE